MGESEEKLKISYHLNVCTYSDDSSVICSTHCRI